MEEQLEFDSTGFGSIQAGLGEINAGQVALTHPVFIRDELDGLWSSEAVANRGGSYRSVTAPDWFLGMTDEFRKAVSTVDRELQGRILEAISYLSKTPVSPKGDGVKRLTGELKDLWRYRIADYRLVYRPDGGEKTGCAVSFTGRQRKRDMVETAPRGTDTI